MVSFLPDSAAANAVAAANIAAAAAIASSALSPMPSNTSLSAEKANCIRLMSVYERLSGYLNGSTRFEASDVKFLCYSLAKAVNCAIILNNVPVIAHRFPSLVKKLYDWRKNTALLSAIMVVLLSIKNACRRGWFQPTDSKELLIMADEICNSFCTEVCSNSLVGHAFETISKIIPKFYPHLKLCSLIASFEAKPGYDVLMYDFYVPKNQLSGQSIVLVVVNTQNLETSSCIAGPVQVSFLLNGKGVDKRNNASLEHGPQLPTDLSKMLKYGINILQAVGYFDGTYLIAVAYMSRISNFSPVLKDYIQPTVAAFYSDSEIIEGPSRIPLNCPISLKRIKTPVKGHLCKHRQCFDYNNFIKLNSRKPNWRCPHCNQPVCLTDLRIDQNMVKILKEAGDVAEVVIHSDGSWVIVGEHERYASQSTNGPPVQAVNVESETNCTRNSVDLTMEEDEDSNGQEEVYLNVPASQTCNNAFEAEDRKPLLDVCDISVSRFLADPQLSSYTFDVAQLASPQTGHSMQATFMSSSHAANGFSGVLPPVGPSQIVPPNTLGNFVTTDVMAPVLDETPITLNTFPIMNILAERVTGRPITRHDRTPMQSQAAQTSMTTLENFSQGLGIMDIFQVPRVPETSAMQRQDLSPHHNPYILNSADGQPARCLPSSNSTHGGRPLPSQWSRPTDLDLLQASNQPNPQPFLHSRLQTLPGFQTSHPPIGQATNVRPPIAAGLQSSNLMNQRNQIHVNRPAPTWRPPPTSSPSLQPSRVVTADSWRSLTGSSVAAASLLRSDGLPELPSGQNWRPIRRMRGSLTGSEYSAVLNHYMAPSIQSTTTRAPMSSSTPSASDHVAALIANNLLSQVAVNRRDGSSPCGE